MKPASNAPAELALAGEDYDTNVERTVLPNGVTVVTDRMEHLESASLGVWLQAGARDEMPEEHGISHLVEHMAFKGTSTRSAQNIAETIEDVGGDLNASTSTETTSFHARVLRKDVPLALDLLSEILTDSKIDADELTREKHVILQEIGAAQDNPEDVCFDDFQQAAFAGQPLGRPIMGTPETVTNFTPDAIRKYLADHYHGSNMVVAASGAVDHADIVKQVEKRLGSLPAESVRQPEPGFYTGGEILKPRELQEAQIALGFGGRAYQARDYYASQVLATALGGGMSSRLFQQVREKRGLCYSIYAFHWAFSDTGVFGIHAATEADDVEELIGVVCQELLSCADNLSQKELDRARAQIEAGLLMAQESPAARCSMIARQFMLFGRQVTNEELMDRLAALNISRLRELAADLFTSGPPTISATGPIGNLSGVETIARQLGTGTDARPAAASVA
jgi:predicted Zn-dependent peptidase